MEAGDLTTGLSLGENATDAIFEPRGSSLCQAADPRAKDAPDALKGLSEFQIRELRALEERGQTTALHDLLKIIGFTKMGARAKAIAALQAMPPTPPPPPPVEIKKGFLSSAPSRISRGARVRIQGLKARPELNGKTGTVGSYDKETGRYKVVLDAADGGDVLALKPAALEELPTIVTTPPTAAVDVSDPDAALAALSSHPPLRCPTCLLSEVLPRLPDVTSKSSVERLKKMLSGGEAFVAPASSVVGEDMLRWDFEYLREHLPPAQRYDVFYVRDRLVMSHSLRYSGGDIPGATSGGCGEVVVGGGEGGGGEGGGEGDAASALGLAGDAPFAQSKVSFMTFADFLAASEAARAAGEGAAADAGGERPYLGLDLLKRSSKLDADGRLGAIGEALSADVHKFDFAALRGWGFPVISAMHLFVGSEATCYHTHYDLNPNLHFQLVGRKRFLLFPPDSWPHLHPFPIHHDLDRRSRVNLDAPDDERFPTWREARGMAIELQPGDCLYIPPFWWHHVQTVTTPCVSMAVWCYDTHPESVSGGRDLMPSSGAAKHISDAKRKDKIKAVKEQVKLVERDVLRGTLPESAGRIASVAVQAAKDTKEPTPTVTNSFGGHFYGLCPAGAKLSLGRWVEQLFGQMIVMPAGDAGADGGGTAGAAGQKASESGEAYAGPIKQRAVAGWLRRVGEVAQLVLGWTGGPKEEHPISKIGLMSTEQELAEQTRRGLLPLSAPFGQLIAEIFAILQMDLDAGPEAVAPFLINLTAESRFDD